MSGFLRHWLTQNRQSVLHAFILSLLVVGLSACSSMPDWFSSPGPEVDEEFSMPSFVEPNPGLPVRLERVWRQSLAGSPDRSMVHPYRFVVAENQIYLGTFEGNVLRLDADTTDLRWKAELGASISCGVALDEKHLYVGTREGEMLALDRNSGALVWRQQFTTSIVSAPAVSRNPGLVIFLTLDNHTRALNSATGEPVWSHNTLIEPLVAMGGSTPQIDDDRVYVGYSSGEVFGLELESGKALWNSSLAQLGGRREVDLLQDVDADLVMAPRRLFAVNHQGALTAFFPSNGVSIWQESGSGVANTPLVHGEVLYLSDLDGYVRAMSVDDGTQLWKTQVSDGVLTSPVMFGETLLVADNRERFISLDPASGRVVGLSKLGEPVYASPVVSNNRLYLWTNEGSLIRYDQ
ncbi:MAG: PQQ-binding-like beta-propeller repeat protein [Magnetococcales bacterium]|nr:PQQ-binding-like beta-propeller repeat protein [Magnetococcales bacterium]